MDADTTQVEELALEDSLKSLMANGCWVTLDRYLVNQAWRLKLGVFIDVSPSSTRR
ncbi:hypothetical protein RHMOL_Rhmol07G0270500 [Rhododendron molle]|uniref:Uncharacterized protein n=1 Tax=Rhododendron molle TaxID=49168 RepID=A0ACC0N6A1_RHOML|nr:hypothetical protein RHMOL_Rhmol07G0270500 [Rhododendron molle]